MPEDAKKSSSHLGFFIALLVVVALGFGAYWTYTRFAEPIAEQQQTAAQNPGAPHPPKTKEPGNAVETRGGKPSEAAPMDSK